jgi:multicomponent K+:H+ antiporter subunit A
MFFAEVLEVRWRGIGYWAAPAAATLAGVFSVAYAARFIYSVFIRGDGTGMPKAPHEPPRFMRAPVDVLVILVVVVGVAPAMVVGPLLTVAAAAVTGTAMPPLELQVWHGFNVPLAMSAVAMVGGALAYAGRRRLRRLHARLLPPIEGRDVYDAVVRGSVTGAHRLTAQLANGSLQRYAVLLLGAAAVVVGVPLLGGGTLRGPEALVPVDAASAAAGGLLAVAAVGVVALRRRRYSALVLMSVVGLVVSLAFVRLAAPDLALTQLLVEVVTTVLVMLALHFMPQQPPRGTGVARRVRDGIVAAALGAGTAAIAWAVMTRPAGGVADYYLAQSKPLGGGTNVVNVILVDFRGFDTLGEITVLGIAGLGIYTLLQGLGHQVAAHERGFARDRFPVVLTQLTRVLLPFALGISAYLFLRGHNMPGGGFIAALLTSVALILQFLSSGIRWTESRLPIDFRTVIATGVLIALVSGLVPWAFGGVFLDQHYAHLHLPLVGDVELASAAVFDLGVYVAVVGAVMVMLERLGRLLEGGPEDPTLRVEDDPWKP